MSAAFESSQPRPVVYLDESYIHHHYSLHNDSIYHPCDAFDSKPRHKGRRLCFIAAIKADGRDNSKLLTYEAFEGGRKQPKDYHAMFNHTFFVVWFWRLLDDVEALGKSNAIIVMMEACVALGIPTEPREYRSTLWTKLKKHVADNVVPVIVKMATDRGHDVIFTPPYHSDMQPIEMVRSYVNGGVGRQYNTSTKFPDVRERLDHEFDRLPSSVIYDCICHTTRKVVDLSAYPQSLDDVDDAAGSCFSSDSESDSDGDSCDDCDLADFDSH
ncbi:hypothetical protein H257_15128, partial [Aphanomyces astaci]